MPLCTQVVDIGTDVPRKIRWGFWHLVCMSEAVRFELGIELGDPDYPILNLWSRVDTRNGFTLERGHTFVDPVDSEVFHLNAGDTLSVWRE